MLSFESFELVVCNEPDGALRLRPVGALEGAACQRLNEAIIAALQSGAARIDIAFPGAVPDDEDVVRVLRAGASLARHLDVDFRVVSASR